MYPFFLSLRRYLFFLLCGFAARCAERLRLSAISYLDFRGYAPNIGGHSPRKKEKITHGKWKTCRTSGGEAAILGFRTLLLVPLMLGPTSPDQSPTRSSDTPDDPEVTINARLIAGEAMMDPSKLSFEITAQRPIPKATLSVAIGGRRYQKAIRIGRSHTTDFTMPDIPWSERISYQLSFPDGRPILNGELRLSELMAQGQVTVSDIRTDRSAYNYGDKALVTVLLSGPAQQPLRLEIKGRDANGNLFFIDQRRLPADRRETAEEFSIMLPESGPPPLKCEFLLFDDETRRLSDSGEFELPLAKKH